MKSTNHSSNTNKTDDHTSNSDAWTKESLATIRTTARDFVNPIDYQHPYPSMSRFAEHLALRYDANRTRHSYYRQLRLIHQHAGCDPATVTEPQLRDYFLFVKLKKHWTPKSIRQARAAASLFFVNLFSQIRTKDHDTAPAVLTRRQVHDLLVHIRLRRYRTPLKLIYCCGLRHSECLGLTIHDIKGQENKLFIRHSKGHQDRVVPLPTSLWQELRRYWACHRHPLLLFPNAGRGDSCSFRGLRVPPKRSAKAGSTMGVFAGSARQFVTPVFTLKPGALRSNTPFKVRRGDVHISLLG